MSRLENEIKKYQETFKLKVPQDIQDIMLNGTKDLKKLELSKNALKVGQKMKDFNLKNVLNKDVSLSKLFENNDYLVINFYRGAWCPYCNLELKALQDISKDLEDLNASLIAISPQTPDASLSTKEKNELSFEVLSDLDNKLAKECGLVFSLSDEIQKIYTSFGIDLEKSNESTSHDLPMPAVFVINKNKEILYSFVDEDYTKRCEPQKIIDIIKKDI